MNKLIAVLSLGLLFGFLSVNAEAAPGVRGAKASKNINYSTTVSSVSVSGPATVYQVVLSTGTQATDYVALFDSATSGAIAGATVSTNLKARIYVTTTTANTVVTFDPPLQFNNGIVAANSTSTMWSLITYERGRVTSGY